MYLLQFVALRLLVFTGFGCLPVELLGCELREVVSGGADIESRCGLRALRLKRALSRLAIAGESSRGQRGFCEVFGS